MVKILLINPQRNLKVPDKLISIPIGMATLANFLIINGFQTEILDTVGEDFNHRELSNGIYKCGLSDDKVYKFIENYQPTIVGIGCSSSLRFPNVVNIAKLVKKQNPQTLVVIWGLHATMCAEEIMKTPEIDFIIMGEYEIPFITLLNKIKVNNRDPKDLKAVSYRLDDKVFISPDRILVDNLDGLPPPAYNLLPLENYFKYTKHDSLTREKRQIAMVTSRGCPWKCANCNTINMWGQVHRVKNIPVILSELETLIDVYNIQEISFEDLSLTFDVPRIQSLCREIIHRNYQFRWSVYLHNQKLDPKTQLLMKQAGCYRFNFGVESEEKIKFNCQTL